MYQHHPMTGVVVFLSVMLSACGGGGGGGGGGDGGGAPATQVGVALPVTGQATCYSDIGVAINCNGTGQDGDVLAGQAVMTRFTVGTGATADCVTDNLTGLVWHRAPSSVPDTWANALAAAEDLSSQRICGFGDWRLPNRKELRSLIDYSAANNATTLNALGFSGVQASNYWSSSSYASSAALAWIVNLFDGDVFASIKSNSYYVWPVRAGQ